ncbi:MAG TPA: VOC family protein [Gaiellaceae bacterium]|jgi:predicted enzyme related to lactoylglutathione lyase
MIDVTRVDYIRVPVDDIEKAKHFYGEVLGLARNEHLDHDDWVEYEASNVTLAVMTPETHDDAFAPLPPSTIALGVPDVAAAKAQLETQGVEVGEMWDSGVCHGACLTDPAGNRILLHHRYKPYEQD